MTNRLSQKMPCSSSGVCLALLASALCLLSFPSAATAADGAPAGTSSRKAKQQAIDSLPYHQLNAATKRKLSQVINKPSFYRRLPATAIDVDPDYLQFLVRYPEVIVDIWQLMGVTKMSSQRTGPFTVNTDDGAGTISSLELVYGSRDLHIYYGKGSYEGPIIRKPLTGNCVLILRTNYKNGVGGSSLATNQLDVFLKVENSTIGFVAKTLQPLVGPTADHNFVESLKFVQRLNETTRNNGPGVQRMASRFSVDESVRDEFIEVAGEVYQRAIRAAPIAGQTTSPTSPASYDSAGRGQQYSLPVAPTRSLLRREGAMVPANSGRSYGHRPPVYQNVRGGSPVGRSIERTAQATNSPYAYRAR